MNDDATRIEQLEFKVAHLEQATLELSDVIYRQQRQIDAITEANRQLLAQLEAMDAKTDDATRTEIPPHY